MSVFTAFDPATQSLSTLVGAIYNNPPGAAVVPGSVSIAVGSPSAEPSTISFYDGSLAGIGIGAGLLLTSGDPTPGLSNSDSSATEVTRVTQITDADLQATVDHVFADAGDKIYDLTYLQFQINVTDTAVEGLSFSLVFGSEEFPDFIDDYVDVAGVYVNGVNYALFNGNVQTPLSVLHANVDAGNFRDNMADQFPIEYNAVSKVLQISAPVHQGVNTIKIAIADTGDAALDSGIIVSGMQAVNFHGVGLTQQVTVVGAGPVSDTAGNQFYVGNGFSNLFSLVSGHDLINAGPGVDTAVFNVPLSGFTSISGNLSDLTLGYGAGNSAELVDVERVVIGGSIYIALDTNPGGDTWDAYALLHLALNNPTPASMPQSLLSQWTAVVDQQFALGHDLGDVAQLMINAYAPGVPNAPLIGFLYQNLVGSAATPDVIAAIGSYVGVGHPFETMGDLFAFAATQPLNTSEMVGFTGGYQLLDIGGFPH